MNKLLIFSVLIILAGCATTTKMYGPDGKEMTAISCDGSAVSPSVCFKKASDLCGAKGYDILASDGSATPISTSYGQANRANALVVSQSGVMVLRTLYMRCKP
jgi:hypothetical protein